tara:strand:- start:145 stop:444 length:300 start_codon:yes stop_codon:yes gene_type:complete
MAWLTCKIEFDGSTLSGWAKPNNEFTAPFSLGLKVGDTFKVDGTNYISESVVNIAGRGEQLLIIGKVVKNDKSKTRRNGNKAGGKDMELQSYDGLPSDD